MWIAETINGWIGRHSADAAIIRFEFSPLRALERHCRKYSATSIRINEVWGARKQKTATLKIIKNFKIEPEFQKGRNHQMKRNKMVKLTSN